MGIETTSVLAGLKYISFVITAASSIFGLVKETTIKDPQGQKKLTRAGQLSIAITICSALIGILSYGLESFLRGQEEADSKIHIEIQEQKEVLRSLEQTQRILLASQPIRHLDFKLTFSNLPIQVMEKISEGEKSITEYFEGDDEIKFLDSSATHDIRSALERVTILFPVLREISGAAFPGDIVLLLDLDGTGSVLLPIGYVTKNKSNGYLDNSTALNLQLDLHNDSQESIDQFAQANPLPYECGRLQISVNKNNKSLTISGKVPSQCMEKVIHRPVGDEVTASLSRGGRMVLLEAGKDGLPIDSINATNLNYPVDLCWEEHGMSNLNVAYELVIVPNGVNLISLRKSGILRKGTTIHHGGGPESESLDLGKCTPFVTS